MQCAGEEAVITYNNTSLSNDNDDDNKSESEIPSDLIISDTLPEVDENSLSSLSDHDDDDNNDNNVALDERNNRVVGIHKIHRQDNLGLSEIQFNSKYFNRDTSSSSDDDSITRGLSFQDLSGNVLDGETLMKSSSQQMSQSYHPDSKTKSNKTVKSQSTSSVLPNLSGMVNNFIQNAIQNEIMSKLTNTATTSDSNSAKVRDYNLESSDEDEFEFINRDDLNP